MLHPRQICWITLASALCACSFTQPPANVTYKGSEFYGRNGASMPSGGYNSSASAASDTGWRPSYAPPTQEAPAAMESVGVQELPPIQSTNLPPIGPQSNAAPVKPKDAFVADLSAPPATLPPVEEVKVSEAKPIKEEHVLKLPSKTAMAERKEEVAAVQKPIPAPVIKPVETATIAKHMPAKIGKNEFIWPVEGKVLSAFGEKPGGRYNDGINIAGVENEPIMAAGDGDVVYSGNKLKGYGNMTIIRHSGSVMTAYAHASRLAVKKGDRVKRGQVIAYVGKTGGVKTPQLHFAVREGRDAVNPEKYLSRNVAAN